MPNIDFASTNHEVVILKPKVGVAFTSVKLFGYHINKIYHCSVYGLSYTSAITWIIYVVICLLIAMAVARIWHKAVCIHKALQLVWFDYLCEDTDSLPQFYFIGIEPIK